MLDLQTAIKQTIEKYEGIKKILQMKGQLRNDLDWEIHEYITLSFEKHTTYCPMCTYQNSGCAGCVCNKLCGLIYWEYVRAKSKREKIKYIDIGLRELKKILKESKDD